MKTTASSTNQNKRKASLTLDPDKVEKKPKVSSTHNKVEKEEKWDGNMIYQAVCDSKKPVFIPGSASCRSWDFTKGSDMLFGALAVIHDGQNAWEWMQHNLGKPEGNVLSPETLVTLNSLHKSSLYFSESTGGDSDGNYFAKFDSSDPKWLVEGTRVANELKTPISKALEDVEKMKSKMAIELNYIKDKYKKELSDILNAQVLRPAFLFTDLFDFGDEEDEEDNEIKKDPLGVFEDYKIECNPSYVFTSIKIPEHNGEIPRLGMGRGNKNKCIGNGSWYC